MASSTQWKLRRLAARVKRVLVRRSSDSPSVAAFADTIGPKADTYIADYDAYAKFVRVWTSEMDDGRSAVAALLAGMRRWLPLALRDVPGFDATEYGDRPTVPDDVIEDGSRFLDVLAEARTATGAPMPWAEKAVAELDPLLAAAAKEWIDAETADAQLQAIGAKVRDSAAAFDGELQLFRRTLLSALGSRDRDYQRLRAKRAGVTDEDDDPAAPPAPTPPEPALP